MASLVARFGWNVFWMGRYVERAEALARILDINETYARDKPEGPDWLRVLDLYADTKRFTESNEVADAASVSNFYMLDRNNPTSIASSVASARENARSVRHLISTEMWTHLNMFHNQIGGLTQRDIRLNNLSRVCADIRLDCQSFEGIAEGTFFRGEAWCFYQMGKYLERADQTTRILDMGYDRITDIEADGRDSIHWSVLLRSVAGYHAFRSLYPAGSSARDIAGFLLYDQEFPRAVALCVERVTARLHELEDRHDHLRHARVEEARRSLAFTLETGLGQRVTPKRLHKFIDDLQIALGDVSAEIGNAYLLST
ncbi:MAG: alpha-E domain-containing protein [Alphaproteobacteria bacterium]